MRERVLFEAPSVTNEFRMEHDTLPQLRDEESLSTKSISIGGRAKYENSRHEKRRYTDEVTLIRRWFNQNPGLVWKSACALAKSGALSLVGRALLEEGA